MGSIKAIATLMECESNGIHKSRIERSELYFQLRLKREKKQAQPFSSYYCKKRMEEERRHNLKKTQKKHQEPKCSHFLTKSNLLVSKTKGAKFEWTPEQSIQSSYIKIITKL